MDAQTYEDAIEHRAIKDGRYTSISIEHEDSEESRDRQPTTMLD